MFVFTHMNAHKDPYTTCGALQMVLFKMSKFEKSKVREVFLHNLYMVPPN